MAVVIGIDEAGYGPLLGPLVVSAVAFDVPDASADEPVWTLLRDSVTKRARVRDGRLLITDSKKAYTRAKGVALLEAATLSMLRVTGRKPKSFRSLLKVLSPQLPSQLGEYLWYASFDAGIPVRCRPEGIKVHANAVARSMDKAGVVFLGAWSEILPAGHFNRLVARTRNKSVVLNDLTMRLIHRARESVRSGNLSVFIDKQGGRDSYRPMLMRSFEFAEFEVLEEGAVRSRYRLRGKPSMLTVSYVQKGEDHHLPVALASMFSKYLRELFMLGFNEFWQGRLGDLVSTAGYYQDGKRFLRDIAPEVQRLGIGQELLVRSR